MVCVVSFSLAYIVILLPHWFCFLVSSFSHCSFHCVRKTLYLNPIRVIPLKYVYFNKIMSWHQSSWEIHAPDSTIIPRTRWENQRRIRCDLSFAIICLRNGANGKRTLIECEKLEPLVKKCLANGRNNERDGVRPLCYRFELAIVSILLAFANGVVCSRRNSHRAYTTPKARIHYYIITYAYSTPQPTQRSHMNGQQNSIIYYKIPHKVADCI